MWTFIFLLAAIATMVGLGLIPKPKKYVENIFLSFCWFFIIAICFCAGMRW